MYHISKNNKWNILKIVCILITRQVVHTFVTWQFKHRALNDALSLKQDDCAILHDTIGMDELEEELEALKAILMNDVKIEVSKDGSVRADLKLDGYKVTVEFQGKL